MFSLTKTLWIKPKPSRNISWLIQKVVEKHGITFVNSAGNNGPALSTAGVTVGNVHHSVIDVGAYLTSEMKQFMYNHVLPGNHMVFPFSARGPCIDGTLGVSIVAPGAAVTGVSKQMLTNADLLQGTSMSSPYVVGSIACLISALKAENIPFSPFQIKLALINSAFIPGKEHYDAFHSGYGVLQVDAAFELLKHLAPCLPPSVTDIRIQVNGNEKRGIYLREKWEVESPKDFRINVNTLFPHAENLEEQIKFETAVTLKVSPGAESFVQIPKHFRLPSGNVLLHLDPTKLEPGKAHYAEVLGIDEASPAIGPLFRIPITVIIPEQVTKTEGYCLKKTIKTESGVPQRSFITCPAGSVAVALILKLKDGCRSANFIAQACTIYNKKVYLQEFKKKLHEKEEICFWFKTYGISATMEICLTQDWDTATPTTIDAEIKFFGYSLNQTALSSANLSNEIVFTNHLRGYKLLPKVCFTKFCQPIQPSSAVILPSQKRESVGDDGLNLCLLLTYNYKGSTLESSVLPIPF